MHIATRLLIALVLAVTGVMVVYASVALQQRAELVSDALARETDTLARALQAVADNALRDERFEDLEGVLDGVAEDPETFLAAVLDVQNGVLSGGPADLPACLPGEAIQEPTPDGNRGWTECGGRVRWVSLPVRDPAHVLLVARWATVVERDEATSRVRILLTTLALAGGAAIVILLVLRVTLSRPLEQVMRGVRSIGGPALPEPIELPPAAGELRELGVAFNEMACRLEEKRQSLIQGVEERLALESRVRTEEKFAALGRLTGGLAHELGTPLNVIGVRAEAIMTTPGVSAEGRRQAGEIVAEVDRVADLIRSLTHVARKDRFESSEVDLAVILTDLVNELSGPVSAAGAARERRDLRLHLTVPLAIVKGDRNLLRHAFRNLILNGIQATESANEQTQRTARDTPASIVIRLAVRRSNALVVVEDEGPGVAEKDLPLLFEPFFTTKEVGEGMGLGLAMSRGILEEHGGSVKIEARQPTGLRVICTLPLSSSGSEGGS